ncbi:MAG: 3-phosphoshikimate 1-carboxyvinyltransferase [Sphingomonadaceae bacterium]|nr:3-phosphoshikimate 1-carboxyvinyltransferase [Sphingomonadaceae bacterium]
MSSRCLSDRWNFAGRAREAARLATWWGGCQKPTPVSESPLPHAFSASGPLRGSVRVPGDKSISHRALMLASLAIGESRIEGLLEGEDVLATAAALRAMGADIARGEDGVWRLHGVGVGGLLQPETALAMGNSGTSTRLLMGLLASHAITATFTGDASLSRRPMGRVIEPLSLMGADFTASPGGTLPLTMRGLCPAVPISYRLPVASAQVKSAILLAGLNAPGVTRLIEPVPTRDHSERMLAGFGAKLEIGEEDGARTIAIHGEAELKPQALAIPGDPSSAAFPLVAALLVPGSEVTVENVGVNPTRAGLFAVLREMGANLVFANEREIGGEPVADITARHSALIGIEVPPDIAPSMIDEFPILFVAAALAQGRTVTRGLEELRVKESDRLATMAEGLRAIGARVEERADGLVIDGTGSEVLPGGATVATHLDHRVAMSFAVAGLASRAIVTIDDTIPVATSFPGFEAMLGGLSA